MDVDYNNYGAVGLFSHSAQAKSVIIKYGIQKRKMFGEMSGMVDRVGDYTPKICVTSVANRVIDNYAVSFESMSYFINAIKSKTLKQISYKNRVYFVGDIIDELFGELDTMIVNCVFLYDLMSGYSNTKGRNLNCFGLYPESDNVTSWLSVLNNIDQNSKCFTMLELYAEIFTSSSIKYCFELLESDNVNIFINCVNLFLDKVKRIVDMRYPDFHIVTEELFGQCRDLARIAIRKNTYVIDMAK